MPVDRKSKSTSFRYHNHKPYVKKQSSIVSSLTNKLSSLIPSWLKSTETSPSELPDLYNNLNNEELNNYLSEEEDIDIGLSNGPKARHEDSYLDYKDADDLHINTQIITKSLAISQTYTSKIKTLNVKSKNKGVYAPNNIERDYSLNFDDKKVNMDNHISSAPFSNIYHNLARKPLIHHQEKIPKTEIAIDNVPNFVPTSIGDTFSQSNQMKPLITESINERKHNFAERRKQRLLSHTPYNKTPNYTILSHTPLNLIKKEPSTVLLGKTCTAVGPQNSSFLFGGLDDTAQRIMSMLGQISSVNTTKDSTETVIKTEPIINNNLPKEESFKREYSTFDIDGSMQQTSTQTKMLRNNKEMFKNSYHSPLFFKPSQISSELKRLQPTIGNQSALKEPINTNLPQEISETQIDKQYIPSPRFYNENFRLKFHLQPLERSPYMHPLAKNVSVLAQGITYPNTSHPFKSLHKEIEKVVPHTSIITSTCTTKPASSLEQTKTTVPIPNFTFTFPSSESIVINHVIPNFNNSSACAVSSQTNLAHQEIILNTSSKPSVPVSSIQKRVSFDSSVVFERTTPKSQQQKTIDLSSKTSISSIPTSGEIFSSFINPSASILETKSNLSSAKPNTINCKICGSPNVIQDTTITNNQRVLYCKVCQTPLNTLEIISKSKTSSEKTIEKNQAISIPKSTTVLDSIDSTAKQSLVTPLSTTLNTALKSESTSVPVFSFSLPSSISKKPINTSVGTFPTFTFKSTAPIETSLSISSVSQTIPVVVTSISSSFTFKTKSTTSNHETNNNAIVSEEVKTSSNTNKFPLFSFSTNLAANTTSTINISSATVPSFSFTSNTTSLENTSSIKTSVPNNVLFSRNELTSSTSSLTNNLFKVSTTSQQSTSLPFTGFQFNNKTVSSSFLSNMTSTVNQTTQNLVTSSEISKTLPSFVAKLSEENKPPPVFSANNSLFSFTPSSDNNTGGIFKANNSSVLSRTNNSTITTTTTLLQSGGFSFSAFSTKSETPAFGTFSSSNATKPIFSFGAAQTTVSIPTTMPLFGSSIISSVKSEVPTSSTSFSNIAFYQSAPPPKTTSFSALMSTTTTNSTFNFMSQTTTGSFGNSTTPITLSNTPIFSLNTTNDNKTNTVSNQSSLFGNFGTGAKPMPFVFGGSTINNNNNNINIAQSTTCFASPFNFQAPTAQVSSTVSSLFGSFNNPTIQSSASNAFSIPNNNNVGTPLFNYSKPEGIQPFSFTAPTLPTISNNNNSSPFVFGGNTSNNFVGGQQAAAPFSFSNVSAAPFKFGSNTTPIGDPTNNASDTSGAFAIGADQTAGRRVKRGLRRLR